MKRLNSTLIICVINCVLLSSCAKSIYEKAHLLYKNKEYNKAATKFEKLSEVKKDKYDVFSELAECYYNINNYVDAESSFTKAIERHPDQARLYYQLALTMKLNDKCLEGKKYLNKYLEMEKEKDSFVFASNDFCKGVNNITELYSVEKLKFSNGNSFLNPVVYNNRLYFLSKAGGISGYSICSVNEDDKSDFKQLNADFISEYPVGPFAFDKSDNSLYFTRRKIDLEEFVLGENYSVALEIVQAKLVGAQWKVTSPFIHNDAKYSVGHPTISEDGRFLVFASNKKDALGETDLFICEKTKEGTWGSPKPLAGLINTKYKEITPCFAQNIENKYLLSFASDRPSSNGGMDVYAVEFDGEIWGEVIHFDEPINTSKNEYSLYHNYKKNETMLVSDRDQESLSDEMYNFTTTNSIAGVLRDKNQEPIRGEKLDIINVETSEVNEITTDENGRYQKDISQGNLYQVVFKSEKYQPILMELNSRRNIIPIIYELDLNAIRIANKSHEIIMEEVYFAFNSSEIDEENSKDLIKLLNTLNKYNNISITITGYTDSRGRAYYNYLLSEKRAEAVTNWLVSKGISKNRLSFEGRGEEDLVNKCKDGVWCSEKEHQQNRRTSFSVDLESLSDNY